MELSNDAILEAYAEFEANAEQGEYRKYREVLREVVQQFGVRYGFECTELELNALVDSFGEWKPFPDTVTALQKLKTRYRLVIVSNVDDSLFAITAKLLQIPFDEVITAEQVGSYKPSHRNFETALARIGLPKDSVLHVAQSLYHDIAPCRELGIASVWINRRKEKPGFGATVPANAQPDLELPDLKSLADLAV